MSATINFNQIKGLAYENQILDLLRRDKEAYLWKYTPENILIENGLIGSHNSARLKRKDDRENPLQDTGVDIISMETATECSLVQCKNGYKSGVTMPDLAGFMCWIATMNTTKGYVYYTDKLSNNIKLLPNQNRIQYIQVPFDTAYLPANLATESNDVLAVENMTASDTVFIPDSSKLEYQHQARDLAIEYYRNHDNGVLAMPCGTGKTYTAFLIAQNFKQIVILSPLKQFAKQNMDRFVEYGFPRANTLLVDSDGCRDIGKVGEFIAGHVDCGFLISATYDSADIISSVLDAFNNLGQTLFICDEFHNLSAANVYEATDPMNKIINASGFKKLFMSATPRIFELEEEGETGEYILGQPIYNMSFKYAIDRGFITDYRIWLPSIHEDLTDLRTDIHKELGVKAVLGSENILYSKAIYLFSCLVNTGSHKCIVYCQDTEEISGLMSVISGLNEYYCLDLHMDKITSASSGSSRSQILSDFANSARVELLFSVRILDECIDIPSCDSIYITYPSKSKIRTIQRLMRCTRTISANKYKVGQVFIWCSEYDSVLDTLGGIKEIDDGFAEKVLINEVGQFRGRSANVSKSFTQDCVDVKKVLIGVKEFRHQNWYEKLEMVKKYIDENKKRPSNKDDECKIKILGKWCSHQITNFNKNSQAMTNPTIYSQWKLFVNHPDYSEYFASNNTVWNNNLSKLKSYLDTNKKKPSTGSDDPKIKSLSSWCQTQVTNYNNKKNIMSDPTIYLEWTKFINHPNYSVYFLDNNTTWNNNLAELKAYLDTNKKRPNKRDNDLKTKHLGTWCNTQVRNYNKKTQIMSNTIIYSQWTEFINHPIYSEYFIDNNTYWTNTLLELKTYLNEHKKRPNSMSNDFKVKTLGLWCNTQTTNYTKKRYNMSIQEIYSQWTTFINNPNYSVYFLDNNTIWINNLLALKAYLDKHKQRPSSTSNNTEVKTLGTWCTTQIANYNKQINIMSNTHIYSQWTEFVNHPDYSEYFIDNNTAWSNNLAKLKAYLDANKKRPLPTDKDNNIKSLCLWCRTQVVCYNKKKNIMADPAIYLEWTKFINHPNYSVYFLDNNTTWNNNLAELKAYLDEFKCKPSPTNSNLKIKSLSLWCRTQIATYSRKKNIMSDPTIYSKWKEFVNHPDYSEYFIDSNTSWYNNLAELKNYLNSNNKRPSKTDIETKIKTLGVWCGTQISNYSKKAYIMSTPDIYSAWTEFINHHDYKQYFTK
jgi:superfamily II DNA or RNA helicase